MGLLDDIRKNFAYRIPPRADYSELGDDLTSDPFTDDMAMNSFQAGRVPTTKRERAVMQNQAANVGRVPIKEAVDNFYRNLPRGNRSSKINPIDVISNNMAVDDVEFGQQSIPALASILANNPSSVPVTTSNDSDALEQDLLISQLRNSAQNPAAGAGIEPKVSVLQGVAYGGKVAEANNQKSLLSDTANSISGLLGDFDFKGLLRVLARPEFVAPMGPGQSPITNFVNAAAADRRDRSASSVENRKLAAKEAMDQFNRSMRQGELSVKRGNLAIAQERLDRPKSIDMTEANVKNIGNMVYDLFSKEIDDRVENDERTQGVFGTGINRDMSPQEAREAIQSSIAAQAIGLMQQDRDLNPAQAIAKVLGKGAPGVEQPENKDKHATVGG
tara:strand:+ start:1838 stop:3001 length:1164 start_codon:yes stop_codon:yes gene_type:complete